MKERPILFSGEMVRAILAGRKTQTRRVLRREKQYGPFAFDDPRIARYCPYGQPGDRLWVRETWCEGYAGTRDPVLYRASYAGGCNHTWRPSIFMPRAYSRITLEITDVRVERVQDITTEDACAEGILGCRDELANVHAIEWFKALWGTINAKRGYGWDANPWVWVISFKRIDLPNHRTNHATPLPNAVG